MGKLDLACVYLSGAMEYAADHGVTWRQRFKRLVKEACLKIDCIDPTQKPGGRDIRIGENQEYQKRLQAEGKWRELQDYVHKYRRYDLRFVDNSDFVVAAIDPTIPQWGTADEVYMAEKQHKPILFLCEGGMYRMPRWLIDVVDMPFGDREHNVFENVEQVVDHLVALDMGKSAMSDEWVLIRKHLEEMRAEAW